jgi:hypothetical protein
MERLQQLQVAAVKLCQRALENVPVVGS